jgi:hypothetical protein
MKEKNLAETISIETPCSENWNEMFGNEKTRACSHCDMNVNDISLMTEDEAWKLIDESKGNLCVRYEAHPVTNAPIFADKLYQITRRTGVAAGVLGATLAVSTSVYAQDKTGNDQIVPQSVITRTDQTITSPTQTNKIPEVSTATTKDPPKLMGKIAIRSWVTNPLMVAVQQGKVLKVRYLIAGGVDVNEIDTNYYSRTALHVAVESNNLKMVQILLNAGADVKLKDQYSQTALMTLNGNTSGEILKLIAQYGADVNSKNRSGQTALMEAARYGNFEAIKALIEVGADATLKDEYGNSALDFTSSEEIIKLLTTYGATRKIDQ